MARQWRSCSKENTWYKSVQLPLLVLPTLLLEYCVVRLWLFVVCLLHVSCNSDVRLSACVLVVSSSLLLRVLRLLPSSRQHQSSKIAHFWDRVANCALLFAHVLLHQRARWVLVLLLLNLNTEHFEAPKAPRTATHICKDNKIEQNMAKKESDLITNTSITMMSIRLSRGVHVTRCLCGRLSAQTDHFQSLFSGIIEEPDKNENS